LPHIVTRANFEELGPRLRECEVIFATWSMWELTPEQLDALPNLRAVFYAAGTVKYFAEPIGARHFSYFGRGRQRRPGG
jgi:phosphoglycerate dehydrogenase-like enzyme